MKKVTYRNYYKIINYGSYVNIDFIVESTFKNDKETLVYNTESTYNNMEEAKVLIDYLQEIGAEIEFIDIDNYTE